MMKKIMTLTALMTVVLYSSAQQSDTLKSRGNDWGFVLNLTGLIDNISLGNSTDVNSNNAILAKHHLSDEKVLRLGLGLKSINNNFSTEDSISLSTGNRALQTVDSTESRFDFSISVGMEKHLGKTRRLDPYVAGEIVVGRIGGTNLTTSTDITDVTGTRTIRQTIQQDGGFTFGLNAIAGFNYFFAERISIGAEINLGYVYTTSGGDQSESLVDTPVNGQEINSFVSSVDRASTRGFVINSTAGLTLSFFF